MPEHWGYTHDGTHVPIDEALYDAAKKACENMGKAKDARCIWGMYKKNWEREHGKELLGSAPGGASEGEGMGASPTVPASSSGEFASGM